MSTFHPSTRLATLHVASQAMRVRVRLTAVTSIRDMRTAWEGELAVLDADIEIPLEGPATLTYDDDVTLAIHIVGCRYYESAEPDRASEVILRFIDQRNWSRRNSA